MLPGTKVPVDGAVVWGSSYVNESMVTGESVPVSKEISSSVIGGTINLHGVLHIQATKVGSSTVLSQIISLVETAQMSKAPIQKFADYVSTFSYIADQNSDFLFHIVFLLILLALFQMSYFGYFMTYRLQAFLFLQLLLFHC